MRPSVHERDDHGISMRAPDSEYSSSRVYCDTCRAAANGAPPDCERTGSQPRLHLLAATVPKSTVVDFVAQEARADQFRILLTDPDDPHSSSPCAATSLASVAARRCDGNGEQMTARMVMGTSRLARWVGAPIAVAAVMTLAACGSGAASTSGTTTSGSVSSGSTASTASNPATDAFAACMSKNGVTMPAQGEGGQQGGPGGGGTPPTGTPPAGGGQGATPPTGAAQPGGAGSPGQAPAGVDATTWAAAQQACASLAPTPPGGAKTS